MLGARARIAAYPLGPGPHLERSEPGKLDVFPCRKRIAHQPKHGVAKVGDILSIQTGGLRRTVAQH